MYGDSLLTHKKDAFDVNTISKFSPINHCLHILIKLGFNNYYFNYYRTLCECSKLKNKLLSIFTSLETFSFKTLNNVVAYYIWYVLSEHLGKGSHEEENPYTYRTQTKHRYKYVKGRISMKLKSKSLALFSCFVCCLLNTYKRQ